MAESIDKPVVCPIVIERDGAIAYLERELEQVRERGGQTAREREVAVLIARGLSNREVADALVISERTVEAHTGHIRDKLGVTSRAQTAAWAVEHGLSHSAMG